MTHNCDDPHVNVEPDDEWLDFKLTAEKLGEMIEFMELRAIRPCNANGSYFVSWGSDGEAFVAGCLPDLKKKLEAAGLPGPLHVYYNGGFKFFDADPFSEQEQSVVDKIQGMPEVTNIYDIKFPDTDCLNGMC